MIFSSLLFLCFFLPVTAGIYYLVPQKCRTARNAVLLAASLVFYAWGEPKYILLMLCSITLSYLCGIGMERTDRTGRKKCILVLSLVIQLGLLGFFKYTALVLTTVNDLTGGGLTVPELALPIGISFYTFQALSYVIDVYRGNVEAQHSYPDFAMYICLFPQLIAGPIVRYSEIQSDLRGRAESAGQFWQGLLRFACGLAKKVLLANQIGLLWDDISGMSPVPAATAWIGALAYTFQIYFDFSGYSDMAIGLGGMFGFHFPENFLHPYRAKSITEFWRRWHVTLSTWFREYLYIPLGGNRKGKTRQLFNLLVVWALTGLWHGAGWNFLLWGLYYFVLLAIEKNFLLKYLQKWPKLLQWLYTMILVVIGWVIFACDDFSRLGTYLASLLGRYGFADGMSFYELRTYAVLLVLCAFGAVWMRRGPLSRAVRRLSESRPAAFLALQALCLLVLVGLSLVFLVGDSYNPFLYFRF